MDDYLTKKIELKNVTLVAVSCIRMEETIRALELSMRDINYYEVVLISDKEPDGLSKNIKFKQSRGIKNLIEYSRFMLYELTNYINSEFALVIQYDGYVLNASKWNDDFLNYDYLGAPWRKNYYFTKDGENIRIGNGGFSLRSKKLSDAPNRLSLPFLDHKPGGYNEDLAICLHFRRELEDYGIKFAPIALSSLFSCEERFDDSKLETFGFHMDKFKFIDKLKIFIVITINKFKKILKIKA